MDFRFGTIGEGITDLVVLKSILIGFCDNKDLLVTPLQPTEEERQKANWDQVIKYIQTEDFKQAFSQEYGPDFLVLQIDSDVFGGREVDKEHQLQLAGKSVEETVEMVKALLIQDIGGKFYDTVASRIIFAISVDEIECWLLPVYFPSEKQKAGKTTGCIKTLNEGLTKHKAGFYINEKKVDHYRMMSKPFMKKKDLSDYGKLNQSLSIFLTELEEKTKTVWPPRPA